MEEFAVSDYDSWKFLVQSELKILSLSSLYGTFFPILYIDTEHKFFL